MVGIFLLFRWLAIDTAVGGEGDGGDAVFIDADRVRQVEVPTGFCGQRGDHVVRGDVINGGFHGFQVLWLADLELYGLAFRVHWCRVIFQITLEDGGDLRTGGAALWIDRRRSHAVHIAFGVGPAQHFFCPVADRCSVAVAAEIGAGADVFALVRGVFIKGGGELFAGDRVVWPEGAVAVASHDAAFTRPVNRHGVPGVAFHILVWIAEVAFTHGWTAFEAIEHACNHRAGHGHVWCKFCRAGAGHEAFVIGVDHRIVEPVALAHIRKRQCRCLRRRFARVFRRKSRHTRRHHRTDQHGT